MLVYFSLGSSEMSDREKRHEGSDSPQIPRRFPGHVAFLQHANVTAKGLENAIMDSEPLS